MLTLADVTPLGAAWRWIVEAWRSLRSNSVLNATDTDAWLAMRCG
jgi:endo-1,4-beta-D-glucanase Y